VDLTPRRVVKLTHQVAAPDRSGVLFRIAVLSGAARNANWGGAPLLAPPSPPLPLCGDAFPIEGVLVATYLLSVEALPHCRCGVANKNRIV